MKDNVKITIERAVNKASNAMLAIVKVFEEHAAVISSDYHKKVFTHLGRTYGVAKGRAEAALRAESPIIVGAFSLDADTPGAPASLLPSIDVRTFVEAPVPAPPVAPAKPKWVKPIGRLAGGSKALVYPSGEAEVLPAEELTAVSDKTGFVKDAGFLDDK